MKRARCLLAVAVILFSLCACGNTGNDFDAPVEFYYPCVKVTYGASDSVISSEIREGQGYTEDLYALLELYFRGPESPALRSPFPDDLILEAAEINGSRLLITLSPSFAELTGSELTIACACLTMTALKLADIDSVEILAEDTLLDGNRSIIMDESCILLLDDSEPSTEN